ncbi:quinone oxidoreductase family protein [Nocardia bhagyanarayanae]|uniref:NADPH:quinone reductase-like Zn-dependent oxidoreductase n=1 Tax=Nocardia bhagyanarayanae TaxID=1215925 RepID=A0A543FDT3_9NOCA|nr:zinc-binding dehydrogenase [Nocardia bhagyanarayanae]TQM31876.1 NADPH:quinone reductase-like Zn-dependent oxidoreductase [Nocardia bhagyanarayanae]
MRAIVMTGVGGPEVLVPSETPRPTAGAGELVVRAEAVPVLYPEAAIRAGTFPPPAEPPFVFGFQAAGTVVETGPDVDPGFVGCRVAVATNGSGAYAEYVVAPAAPATPIPDGVDTAIAAAVLMSGSVATALFDTAAPTGDETVLVEAAATGVGAYLTQYAARRGARVIATAGGPAKAAQARKLGAAEVIDHNDPAWTDRLRDVLGAVTLDVVFDSIGGPATPALLDLMTPVRGRMLAYGFLSGGPAPITATDLINRGLTLIGCAGPAWLGKVASHRAQVLYEVAAGTLEPLLDTTMPLDQAAHAHELIERRAAFGTIVLLPNHT